MGPTEICLLNLGYNVLILKELISVLFGFLNAYMLKKLGFCKS